MSDAENIKNRASKNKFLTYFLGEEEYGVDISKVREIIAMMKITSVPRTPKYVAGVINLRGAIIPVIDTRLRFEMPPLEYTEQTAIIIIEINKVSIGFVVDKVEEVLTIDEANISEPPKFGTNINTDFIKNIARAGEMVIMILDLEKLFEAEELSMLDAMSKTN
ncbi:MAG: purine-binding chemotaxis protein CheW [Campylobacteraceae bacterium]|jgi:purine-binding chemotaxis protein CheW|nr:purine-binding chemotaxis protein CheW [Campylobacteraceae bacterium]